MCIRDSRGALQLVSEDACSRAGDEADTIGTDKADDGDDGHRGGEAGGHERRGVGDAHVHQEMCIRDRYHAAETMPMEIARWCFGVNSVMSDVAMG